MANNAEMDLRVVAKFGEIGRWEVAEKSSCLANKTSRLFPERCRHLTCACLPKLVGPDSMRFARVIAAFSEPKVITI